ncbi:2-dehydro-3-deoxygalactonokinase [Aureimonas mangrovi]|uniref:2-dehydro-3-deoxygalactonokinase n=1 Tax=Aureimonas mangrovi TaxID=2758041 RepID=UPI00163D4BEB|nr:2-dehydro-3-deoxygalactonokinase [Aureimonas mangrovi]
MTSDESVRRNAFCAAVDWGTTSFRLWLLDAGGAVIAQSRGTEGMERVRERGFETTLAEHLDKIGAPAGTPVIICGMAGARQGWMEAPYRPVPAPLDELAAHAVRVETSLGDVRILPGVAQIDADAPDVMRGEETQIAGLGVQGDTLVCLPGTHSKWVRIEEGAIADFATFMTGEIFDLLSRHSILRHVMDAGEEGDETTFLAAVREALAEPDVLTTKLFALRAGPLLSLADPAAGATRLSGLLIGAEIGAARRRLAAESRKLLLVSSGRLGALYRSALAEAGFDVDTVDAEETTRTALHAMARRLWPSAEENAR